MKRGFTLSETMVAMLASGIVLTAVMSMFVSAQRMMADVVAESELAVAARSTREKLLFRVSPTISGTHSAGMLSGTNSGWVVENGSGIVVMHMGAVGETLSDVRSQGLRLVMQGPQGARCFVNDWTPDKDAHANWFRSGGIPLVDGSMSDAVSYDTTGGANDPTGVYRVNVDVNLAAKVPWSGRVVRRERVCVPLLGRVQPMTDSQGRY